MLELIGGYDPAKQIILDAMAKGKQVVTANKALLAVHGEEIFETAARHHVDVGFRGRRLSAGPLITCAGPAIPLRFLLTDDAHLAEALERVGVRTARGTNGDSGRYRASF